MPPTSFISSRAWRSSRPTGEGKASSWRHSIRSCSGTGGSRVPISWPRRTARCAAPAARPVLAQAARELLLAQASDWQFIISTGAVVDYAERRFTLHCDDAERLISALSGGDLEGGGRLADELARRDDLFPDVLA